MGVCISETLKPSMQCQQAYSKASKVLGLIERTILYKSKDFLLRLYKILVRPHLEYSVSAWSPCYTKDKLLLERIQHRFTRMVPGLTGLMIRLQHLGIWSLKEKRNRADLLEVFKCIKDYQRFHLIASSHFGLDVRLALWPQLIPVSGSGAAAPGMLPSMLHVCGLWNYDV